MQIFLVYAALFSGKEKSSNKLVDLSIAFAVEILNLVKYLKERKETIICNQIGRAFVKRALG